ncbi:MAG TPA: DUF58 domain-containing protein [Bacillota bacterium]|nr:DUF58 domain-containing protein [Bacillota bacterium]
MSQTFKNRFVLLLLFVIFAVLYAYMQFQGGFVSSFLLTSYSVLLLYELIFYMFPMKGWSVSRSFSEKQVYAGDRVDVNISLRRAIPFPVHYLLYEEKLAESLRTPYVSLLTEQLTQIKKRDVIIIEKAPFFKRDVTFSYALEHIARGIHSGGSIRLVTTDIFGLFKKESHIIVDDELIIYPRQLNVRLASDWAGRLLDGYITTAKSFEQDSVTSTSVKEFSPGDKLSTIHWKQFAKQGELMTKQFDDEKRAHISVALFYDEKNASKQAQESAIEYCAALFNHFTNEQIEVEASIHYDSDQVIRENNSRNLLFSLTTLSHQMKEKRVDETKTIQSSPNTTFVYLATTMNEQLMSELKKNSPHQDAVLLYFSHSTALNDEDKKELKNLQNYHVRVQLITEKTFINDQVEVKSE